VRLKMRLQKLESLQQLLLWSL